MLEVEELMELDGTAVVMLSACETGRGADGMAYMTLARGFTHAGSASVVATLWHVPDEATEMLVDHFYRHLDAGMGRARALNTAQRDMIAAGHEDPVDWAGFVAFGL